MTVEAGAPMLHDSTLIFDVSTIMKGDTARPTGIHRVVLETALAMIELTGGAVVFTRYDRQLGSYRKVDGEAVRSRISALLAVAQPSSGGSRAARKRSARVRGVARWLLVRSGRVAPETSKHVGATLGYVRRALWAMRSAFTAIGPDLERRRTRRSGSCHSSEWSAATTYCSLGLDFSFNDLDYLLDRKRAEGFQVAMAVYDLIPVVVPHFSTRDLTDYFAQLLRVSDTVLVISTQTKVDLVEFATRLQLPLPRVEVIPLSSSLIATTPSRPPSLPAEVDDVGFVVFVSTITARKNHQLLLDVWSRLLRDGRLATIPYLVFGGGRGSLSDETMSRIHHDPELAQRVVHLEGLADPEIAWLYRECAFTLYPSFYEGWGLPVTESLDFGKVCLASDRTSLPEAGEGLAIHLDPTDRDLWTENVIDLWTDVESRHRREDEIRQQHHRRDAIATTSHLLRAIGIESRSLG